MAKPMYTEKIASMKEISGTFITWIYWFGKKPNFILLGLHLVASNENNNGWFVIETSIKDDSVSK